MKTSESCRRIEIVPVRGLGLIHAGDDLAQLILDRLSRDGTSFEDGDALVLTSKIVSKSEGRVVELSSVRPGPRARALARVSGLDARLCELIIKHTRRIWGVISSGPKGLQWARRLPDVFPVGPTVVAEMFASEPTMILAELPNGLCLANAGIDSSNVEGQDRVILLPEDPDASCSRIREAVRTHTGRSVAVIVSDTEMRVNRFGSLDHAIGSWGIQTVASYFGEPDLVGRPKHGGMEATTDMVVAAAALAMGNCAEGVPAVIVRGVTFRAVDQGMMPIQEPPSSYLHGVLFSLWCRLKVAFYRAIGV